MTRKAFVAELNSFLLGKGFLEETPGKLWIARGRKPGGVQIVVVNGRRRILQTSGPEIKIQVEIVGDDLLEATRALSTVIMSI